MKLPTKSESRAFLMVVGAFFILLGALELAIGISWWQSSKWIGMYKVLTELFCQHSVAALWVLIGVGCLAYSITKNGIK